MNTEPTAKIEEKLTAPWRVGIDVGGTFTDLVAHDSSGQTLVVKVASTPDDPSRGVLIALEEAARRANLSCQQFLEGCGLLLHGSTVATNILLQGKGAKVGLLVNDGLRDALEIRRGIRDDQWDHRSPYSPVLVPRFLRLPVRGRLDGRGKEIEPLRLDDVRRAAAEFERQGVKSVAVCLLHSCISALHEEQAAKILEEELAGTPISLSSAVRPIVGEYERSSTVVVNAALIPAVAPYLRSLSRQLAQRGLARPPLLMQSNGGVVSVGHAAARPVELLLSGPAAAVGALRRLSSGLAESDHDGTLSLEIGGTSCDVLLMTEGCVSTRESLDVAGYRVATPTVDIHTVGAGGGTIARVDEAGMLSVGPQGAGANPGPACYALGGTEATVTDAHLVLGRLTALGGGEQLLSLDPEPAREAIEARVARPLGLPVEDAAIGILRVLEQNLVQAVETVSSHRGHDPARLTLVAGGGAGPLHVAAVARRLGVRNVVVPRRSGVFCAEGLLFSDVRLNFERPLRAPLEDGLSGADSTLTALRAQAHEALLDEGFEREEQGLVCELELRYRAQSGTIWVAASQPLEPQQIRRDFEQQHRRLYGHVQPDGRVEVAACRVSGFGRLSSAAPQEQEQEQAATSSSASPDQRRNVYIDALAGWCETPIYAGSELCCGARVEGPALIEEETATLLLGAEDRLAVDSHGNFRLSVFRN